MEKVEITIIGAGVIGLAIGIFLNKGVYVYISHGKFIDSGIPETYKMADTYFKEVY